MATLRFHLPKLARRTPPSGDAGTSAPTEYPSSSVGALPIQVKCQRCGRPSTLEVSPLLSKKAIKGLEYTCGPCGTIHQPGFLKIVEGDGPQESGVTPSPSIEPIAQLLIDAAATMREQNDRLAAVNTVLDQFYASDAISPYFALRAIYMAMGR